MFLIVKLITVLLSLILPLQLLHAETCPPGTRMVATGLVCVTSPCPGSFDCVPLNTGPNNCDCASSLASLESYINGVLPDRIICEETRSGEAKIVAVSKHARVNVYSKSGHVLVEAIEMPVCRTGRDRHQKELFDTYLDENSTLAMKRLKEIYQDFVVGNTTDGNGNPKYNFTKSDVKKAIGHLERKCRPYLVDHNSTDSPRQGRRESVVN